MQVLSLNSSARTGGQSKTELMLGHLVEGLREAGADIDVIHLREKKIKNCIGCFTCMTKTPGRCVLKDDMTNEIFPKWLQSDLTIYATPLFHHTVNATMKTFIERTFPIFEPFLLQREGRWVHPQRSKRPASVVLSVCGFPEMSAFTALTHYVKFLFEDGKNGALWAEIYRPGAEYMIQAVDKQKDILDATRQAGRELVQTQRVSPQTLARIEQPIADNVSDFAKISNCMWNTCISERISRKRFVTEGRMPRPDSIETYMLLMPMGFNPEGAKDIQAVLQYDFTGQIEGSCHFIIADGTIRTEIGPADKPDLTIKTPFDVWMDIMTDKADGTQMFMEEKYTAEGDLDLLLNMGNFFNRKN